jgi:hypothetical protein
VRKWIATILFVAVVLLAFYGPLFPRSPVKPGYKHYILTRADVFYPNGTHLDPAFEQIDFLIASAENYHQMKMTDRITVILVRDWNDFHFKNPWLRGNAVGAATLQTGTVIYVTPKLAEKHFDPAEFLRHELSHAILDQNNTLWRGYKLSRQLWLFEGIAVAFGDQKTYITRDEFLAQVKTTALKPSFEGANPDMRFNYVAWRYFLEYLMKTRSRAAFQSFLTQAMQDPDHVRALFPSSFGASFDNAVSEFESHARSGDL